MARSGERTGYFCAAFFGICLLVFLVQLLPGATYLRLEPGSFTFCSLFRKHSVPWTDVAEFALARQGFNRVVGWNYRPGRCRHVRAASVAKAITGCEGALPDNYGMKPEALAEFMNCILEQHGALNVAAQA